MKAKAKIIPAFLTGGGEMGELIRSFDWSKTALCSPDTWPQSLRIAVRIMLDCPFGMYIAWGNEYIQLYNDGYRPILGATKHPQALGIGTRKTFAEVWSTIGPMFEGVMQGTPVGFPDFTLQLDRNGYLEECVFDFSYSPIRLEDGEVGGVLVTVIETTEKVKAAKALKERELELQFAIEATELGTWDLNPATNKFKGNSRLKEWFGLNPDEEIELPLALAVIADKDRDKVTAAIQTAMQFSSGGHYDIIYTIIHPQTKNEKIVRAKGRASFNDQGIAYRFNGNLQDITEEIAASRLLTESEQRLRNERMVLYNSFMNAPAAIAIVKGETYIYEFANAEYEKLVDRKITIGKTVKELFPEIEQQGVIDILNNVFSTGEPFIANEFPVELINKRTGQRVLGYHNAVVQPIKDEKGNIVRLLSHGVEVTQQVEARKKIEESEKRFSMLADNIPNLAWMAYADGSIFWYNKKWFEYTGTTFADMEGWGWQSVHEPEELSKVLTKWKAAIETGQPFDMVFPLKGADGKFRQFLTRVLPVLDNENEIYRWFGTNTEISKQIEAEEKIKESEAKFRTLAETIPHLVWTATPDGKKNFFNKYFLEYTGLSFEELEGDGWHKIIFSDDLEKELVQWYHHIKTGEDFKIEKRVRHHNGTYRWHLSHSIAQKNAKGKITGWIGTNTDISDQKSFAEELETKVKERTYQLHIQNETFKQAEESSMQGSYSFNLTTGKLAYSDNLYRLIGFEPNEFEPSLEEFNKHVHPEDRDFVTRAAQKVLQSKRADEWHYRMSTKNGQVINIKGTGRVIEFNEEKLLVGTLQDVTKEFELNRELQEKEEYRRQIINNAPDAVIVINEKSIITLWNPKTEEIFGWKAEEVLGLDLTNIIIPTQYRENHKEGMKRFLKTGEARILNKTLELTALKKDGKEFPISLTISQAMQQGKTLFIAFLRDITLEKRTKELAISNQSLLKANSELEASQKLTEKLVKQRDEFISIASHEMKTPLTTAKGYTELLLLSLSKETQSVLYATKANQAVDRLHDLVTELLDASKIQNGKLNYNITTFDFNEMVDESIENFQLSAKNHRIQKTGNFLQQITGDRGRLQQVLINLLSNAVKYSPEADRVLVKIEVQDSKIHVSVQDFGIGMSGKHLNKIFDRYYRVEEHAIHFQGLGIGLYISNNIIERHDGKMWAESEPEKGSTFYFTLPL